MKIRIKLTQKSEELILETFGAGLIQTGSIVYFNGSHLVLKGSELQIDGKLPHPLTISLTNQAKKILETYPLYEEWVLEKEEVRVMKTIVDDEGYIVIPERDPWPEPNTKGIKCGKKGCGVKINHDQTSIMMSCPHSECPLGLGPKGKWENNEPLWKQASTTINESGLYSVELDPENTE